MWWKAARGRRAPSGVVGAALVIGASALVLGVAWIVAWIAWGPPKAGGEPAFAGAATCAECHRTQYDDWRGSQHAHAMQLATPATALGRFDSATVTHHALTSTFLRRGDSLVVRTEGPDGRVGDFRVQYTFGLWPLQQYLVSFPGGRIQPLPMAWDARAAADGGQRWFPLDSEPRVPSTDESHWTGRAGNWNYMCADCHSTAVRKGYYATADTFHTTFADVAVACEACHGPGSAHVRWGRSPSFARRLLWRDNALLAHLDERRNVSWSIDPSTNKPKRSAARRSAREIEVCAQCHARRQHIADGYVAGAPLFDFYDPMLLVPPYYHPDGQQDDEVFTYASFLQSRMHAAGVTCADCHDPHTQKLRTSGNGVCAQCHQASTYDRTAHHGHASGSAGAACASCHMPVKLYMQVDPRHDHSLRIPRPDRTMSLGVPNVCQDCHADRDARWASDRVRSWSARNSPGFQRFAEAFAAADRDAPSAGDSLVSIANDPTQSAIARASALARLSAWPGPASLDAAKRARGDPSPLVRRGVVQAMTGWSPGERAEVGVPLLSDPTRAVRQEAAFALASLGDSLPTAEAKRSFAIAAAEYEASQRYNADRSEARTNLGAFLFARGRVKEAVVEFRAVTVAWPHFTEAWVDLAGALSVLGREPEGETTLRNALRTLPGEARLHHALGLSLARSGRMSDAALSLAEAARLAHFDPAYVYPLAVVLHSMRRGREAVTVLHRSLVTHPDHRELWSTVSSYELELGDTVGARRDAQELVRRFPSDVKGRELLQAVEQRRR